MWKLCSRADDTCRTRESQPRLKGLVAHRVFCLKSVTQRERAANNRPFRQAGGMNRPAPQIDIHVTSSGPFFLRRCLTTVDTSSLRSDPTAQRCSESKRAEFSVNSTPFCRLQRTLAFVLGRKEPKDRCGGSARLNIIRRLRGCHVAATTCPNRPVTRNSSVFIRVHPRFQNAIHQRSDELDVNPRSVEPSCANAQDHPSRGE